MEERKTFIAHMSDKLNELDKEIKKLEEKAETAKSEIKTKYRQKIADLHRKKEEARQKLKEIQGAGEDVWHELKTGVEKTWKTLGDTVKNTWDKFKQET